MKNRSRLWTPEAPLLNLRRYREVALADPKIGVAGRFTVELIHKRTGLIAQRLEFPNMIVDAGLDWMGANRVDGCGFIGAGTGNAETTAIMTDLVAPLARTNNTVGVSTPSESGFDTTTPGAEFAWYRMTRLFTTAQANGQLTEVGLFSASAGGTMFCRNLFRDGSGNAVAVTKTSEFELRVTYEVRWYAPPVTPYTTTINGVAGLAAQATPTNLSAWNVGNQVLGLGFQFTHAMRIYADCTGNPTRLLNPSLGGSQPPGTSAQYSATSGVNAAYASGSYFREATLEWNATTANDTNLRGFEAAVGAQSFHWFEGAGVDKTNTQKLVVVYRKTWDRYTP